jgi:hypothetical protein
VTHKEDCVTHSKQGQSDHDWVFRAPMFKASVCAGLISLLAAACGLHPTVPQVPDTQGTWASGRRQWSSIVTPS